MKNTELSPLLDPFTDFIHLWHMPLFFVLAGWSIWDSLGKRGAGRFLLERVQKLLVPLAFGMVAIGPVLRWAELRTGPVVLAGGQRIAARPDLSLLDCLPTYFDGTTHLTWGHLWFLASLFTFTLLYLPLLALARRTSIAGRIRERSIPAWVVYLPILPLAIVQVTLRERWPGFQNLVDDWANFAYYSLFLGLGFACAALPRFERACHEQWRRAAVLALGSVAMVLLLIPLRDSGNPAASFTLYGLSAVAGWSMVVALLGIARAPRIMRNPPPRAWVESAFPVYVLHQVGVVLAALLVIGLPLPIALKLPLTIALALGLTLGTYRVLLAISIPPLRWVLGLPAPRRAPGLDRRRGEARA